MTIEQKEIYYDGYLKSNLLKGKELLNNSWDLIGLVSGREGSGKSVLAQQIGKFVDPTLNLERIVFNSTDFINVCKKATKGQCIIYDESFNDLSSDRTMSEITHCIRGVLAEIRQKQLFILFVIPSFFDLTKGVALWRSTFLICVYTDKHYNRGYFKFFNYDAKKELYIKGKKFYNDNCVKPNFRGRFYDGYTVDRQAYLDKKALVLNRLGDNDGLSLGKEKSKQLMRLKLICTYVNKEIGLSHNKIAEIIGVDRPRISELLAS